MGGAFFWGEVYRSLSHVNELRFGFDSFEPLKLNGIRVATDSQGFGSQEVLSLSDRVLRDCQRNLAGGEHAACQTFERGLLVFTQVIQAHQVCVAYQTHATLAK
jgi:hypothetical protein